jgi:hypothetical protein
MWPRHPLVYGAATVPGRPPTLVTSVAESTDVPGFPRHDTDLHGATQKTCWGAFTTDVGSRSVAGATRPSAAGKHFISIIEMYNKGDCS